MENSSPASSGPVIFATSQLSVSFEVTIPGILSTRTTPINGRAMVGQVGPDYFTLLTGIQGHGGPISVLRLKRSQIASSIDLASLTWTTGLISGDLPYLSAAAGLPTFATTSLSLTFHHASTFWAFMYTSSLPAIPAWTSMANAFHTVDNVNRNWHNLLELYNTYPEFEFPMQDQKTEGPQSPA